MLEIIDDSQSRENFGEFYESYLVQVDCALGSMEIVRLKHF